MLVDGNKLITFCECGIKNCATESEMRGFRIVKASVEEKKDCLKSNDKVVTGNIALRYNNELVEWQSEDDIPKVCPSGCPFMKVKPAVVNGDPYDCHPEEIDCEPDGKFGCRLLKQLLTELLKDES